MCSMHIPRLFKSFEFDNETTTFDEKLGILEINYLQNKQGRNRLFKRY